MTPTLERAPLLDDLTLRGRAFCSAYSRLVDGWLRALWDTTGVEAQGRALVAVGGYGRAELCPYSDIDVVLLTSGRGDVAELAERLWYPIWDENLKLGHAVRSIREAVTLAGDDLETATSMLEVRHIAGDESLTVNLAREVSAMWRKRAKRWLTDLARSVDERHERAGEVAFLLEPELKEGRGGLRDVHAIGWAEAAERVMFHSDLAKLSAAYDVLLEARVELHRRAGRAGDTLWLQEQDGVAESLGDPDADALMRRVATAARGIAWRSDETWHSLRPTTKSGWFSNARPRELPHGLVLVDEAVDVGPTADLGDPWLALRAGVAAASAGTRIRREALERLADTDIAPPTPWPAEGREAFVALLAQGRHAVPVIEALDQHGLFARYVPEWSAVQCKPQRNAYHRFTVDRHLCETAANATSRRGDVARPDLLLVGALLHDIGKGYPGDHTTVGIELVAAIGARMGFPADDIAVLAAMVRHHLTLADVATRRDLGDEGTIRHVAELLGNVEVLQLLDVLTEADSLATGPSAWGSWKQDLVRQLVAATAAWLSGAPAPEPLAEFPTVEHLGYLASGREHIAGVDDTLTLVTFDRTGLFSRAAGVLALNGLDVLSANAYSDDRGMAVDVFTVRPTAGPTVAWDRVIGDLHRALDGRLALSSRLAERARTYRPRRATSAQPPAPPRVLIDNTLSERATVVEVHAPDEIGVLHRIARAFADLDLDIRSARIQTLGNEVVDSFYLRTRDHQKITDPDHLAELERAVLFEVIRAPSSD